MAKILLLAMIIIACASVAAAQDDYKRWDIFGGYSHNRVDTGVGEFDPNTGDFTVEREGFHGFNASVTRNFWRYIGIKGDVSGHYKSRTIPFGQIASAADIKSSLYNFLGGVQIKDNSTESTFRPFAHGLAGVAYARNRVNFGNDFCIAIFPSPCPVDFSDTDTGFAAALGGGLDIRASNRIDIRAVQVDYNPTRLGNGTQHNFRIGVGIVIH